MRESLTAKFQQAARDIDAIIRRLDALVATSDNHALCVTAKDYDDIRQQRDAIAAQVNAALVQARAARVLYEGACAARDALAAEVARLREALPVRTMFGDGPCYGIGDECWPAQSPPATFPQHSARCLIARAALRDEEEEKG